LILAGKPKFCSPMRGQRYAGSFFHALRRRGEREVACWPNFRFGTLRYVEARQCRL
jgi:hypothetical protein